MPREKQGGEAPGLPAAAEAAALPDLSRQVLVLRAGGERLGLVVEEIAAVVEQGRLSAVPKAPPAVRGIMNHVGSVLTVASLAELLGLPEAPAHPSAPTDRPTDGGPPLVVVVERRDVRLGFLIDRIEGVTLTADLALDLTPEPVTERPGPADGPAPVRRPSDARPLPFSRGWLTHDGAPVRVLDGAAIVDEILARFERRDRRA